MIVRRPVPIDDLIDRIDPIDLPVPGARIGRTVGQTSARAAGPIADRLRDDRAGRGVLPATVEASSRRSADHDSPCGALSAKGIGNA